MLHRMQYCLLHTLSIGREGFMVSTFMFFSDLYSSLGFFSSFYTHYSRQTYFKISVVTKFAWIYLWKLTTAGKTVQRCFHSKNKGYWWLLFNTWDKISDYNYSNTSSYIYHENLSLQWMSMKWTEVYRLNKHHH